MTVVKVKGFKIYRDRTGTWRCYHRASGKPIDLLKHPLGSASFLAECARIGRTVDAAASPKPGTLGKLMTEYKRHGDYQMLKERTRADYSRCMDYLAPLDSYELTKFRSSTVVKIRDKAGEAMGRKWGNYVKTVLSLLFSWGVERGYLDENPARGVKGIRRSKNAGEANRPWSDDERAAVLDALPDQLKLPVALMMYCGIDPVDARTLPKTAIKDGAINTSRRKTGQPVWVPLPQPALDIYASAPRHDAITVCATSRGTPWTKTGMESTWRPIKLMLEREGKIAPGLTFKGLRHTVATILAEMGYDERTIADMLGQSTIEMARHYSRRANKNRKMQGVVKQFEAELERRKLSNKGGKSV